MKTIKNRVTQFRGCDMSSQLMIFTLRPSDLT